MKRTKSEGERERKRERGGSGCNGSNGRKIGLEAIFINVVTAAIVTNEAKHELILQHLNDKYT